MLPWGELVKAAVTNPCVFIPLPIWPSSSCCGGFSEKDRACKLWENAVQRTLLVHQSSELGISRHLHEILLAENTNNTTPKKEDPFNAKILYTEKEEDEDTPTVVPALPFRGLPRQPYCKELARRLYRLSQIMSNDLNEKVPLVHPMEENQCFLVSAELLGLKEIMEPKLDSLPPIPRTATRKNLQSWLCDAGDDCVLRILGMRKTVGTNSRLLLPPPRQVLEEAAMAPHSKGKGNNRLTVAARARSKHAHRGKDRFFGVVAGSAEKQNMESAIIVKKLFNEAVWINIHVFGGIEDPVLEVREETGYGGRWQLFASNKSTMILATVEFRGFLEPQMPDGHEKGWRH